MRGIQNKIIFNYSKYTQVKNGLLTEEEINKVQVVWGILPLPAGGLLISFYGFRTALADKNGNMTGYSTENIINDIDEYLKDINLRTYLTNS